jgi:TM2 domain-containing membrane protein YozV
VPNTGHGFCQDCGKPLTAETVRRVETSTFCEPCLQTRVAAGAVPPAAGGPIPVRPVSASEPHPLLAGLLGLIPGVGAIYNGQFAKGFVHLIIFAILASFADHVSGVFGLFVFGWVCYQVVDAYQTAVARRDGLALPNPFGLNDIGERMGLGKSWGVVTPPSPPAASAVPPAGGPVGTAPDWVGYVHPDAIPVAPPVTTYTQQAAPVYGQTPYASTYTGAETPYAVPVVASTGRRFPVGAFWLIGLGLLILIGNFLPDVRINGRWFLPVFFAGLAVFIFTRRVHAHGTSIVCYLRWPVTLMVLAILFALQAGYVATLGQTWPVLLVTVGGLLLLERTVGAVPPPVAPYVPVTPVTPLATDDLSAHVRNEHNEGV